MTTQTDVEYKVTIVYGHVECRAWIDTQVLPNGEFILVGMGSSTYYDQAGNSVDYKQSPTGLVGRL